MITVNEYIAIKNKLSNTTFRITPDGKGFYIEDGELLTRDQFNRKYPLPMSLVSYNGANADKSKDWLIS